MRYWFAGSLLVSALAWPLAASPLTDFLGEGRLTATYGNVNNQGENVHVAMVEAPVTPGGQDFAPNTSDSDLAALGRSWNIYYLSPGTPSTSSHATYVARNFFGSSSSLAPKVPTIDVYSVNAFIYGELQFAAGSSTAPWAPAARVFNHSWTGTFGSASPNIETLMRLDLEAARDNTIHVVGVPNNSSPNVTNGSGTLLASAYNVISVGVLNGNNGWWTANVGTGYPGGRPAPLLVVPESATSFATPYVSGAAAVLVEAAHANASLSNNHLAATGIYDGETNVVVKSALLAGARRDLVNTTNSGTDPNYNAARSYTMTNWLGNLDSIYGAGVLAIDRSYNILEHGEQNSFQDGGPSLVSATGWDYDDHFGLTNTTARYTFNLAHTTDFTASLNWNAVIDLVGSSVTVRNLDLKLFRASDNTLIQSSVSTQNTENIYVQNLAGGQYYLEVDALGGSYDTQYGLAWFSIAPEPGAAMAMITGSLLVVLRRRSRG